MDEVKKVIPDINKADGWVTNSGFKKQMLEWKCTYNALEKRLTALETQQTKDNLAINGVADDITTINGQLAELQKYEKLMPLLDAMFAHVGCLQVHLCQRCNATGEVVDGSTEVKK